MDGWHLALYLVRYLVMVMRYFVAIAISITAAKLMADAC